MLQKTLSTRKGKIITIVSLNLKPIITDLRLLVAVSGPLNASVLAVRKERGGGEHWVRSPLPTGMRSLLSESLSFDSVNWTQR